MSALDELREDIDHREPGSWRVEPDRTALEFRTRSMLGLMAVKGRFTRYAGTLTVDEQGGTSGELIVDTDSIETGIQKRDTHLRTADFFHATEYPHMVFTLRDLAADASGELIVTGVLKIRDKELDVVAPARLTRSPDRRLELSAEFPIDHKAAGLGWAKPGMVPGRVQVATTIGLVPSEGAES
jgi:polyisoprenoid-binding protein YceI